MHAKRHVNHVVSRAVRVLMTMIMIRMTITMMMVMVTITTTMMMRRWDPSRHQAILVFLVVLSLVKATMVAVPCENNSLLIGNNGRHYYLHHLLHINHTTTIIIIRTATITSMKSTKVLTLISLAKGKSSTNNRVYPIHSEVDRIMRMRMRRIIVLSLNTTRRRLSASVVPKVSLYEHLTGLGQTWLGSLTGRGHQSLGTQSQ